MLALGLRRIPFSEWTRRRLTAKARADAGPAHLFWVRRGPPADLGRELGRRGRVLVRRPPPRLRPPPPRPLPPFPRCFAIIASDVSHETNDEDRPYGPRPQAQAMAFGRLYRRTGPRIRPGSTRFVVIVGSKRRRPPVPLASPILGRRFWRRQARRESRPRRPPAQAQAGKYRSGSRPPFF
jgi:hypothetical protein